MGRRAQGLLVSECNSRWPAAGEEQVVCRADIDPAVLTVVLSQSPFGCIQRDAYCSRQPLALQFQTRQLCRSLIVTVKAAFPNIGQMFSNLQIQTQQTQGV